MKICVLMKQIPDPASPLRIKADESWIEENNLVYITNESDQYALEEALLLKEAHGGEVIAATLGPERAGQVLKDALSKGADRAIHLQDAAWEDLDSLGMARIFAATLKAEQCDLILTGLQADDTGDGQLGPMLAECIDLPQVNLVVATEISGANLKVKQELEGGWFQYVTTTMPALLAIQSGINKPRYASLKGIMAMKRKEIKVLSAADLGLPSEEFAPDRVLQRVYFPSKTKETVFIEGSVDEMVTQLLDKLTHDAKVLV